MPLLDLVRRTILKHRLADRTTRVVSALSGGSDSVALLHLLRDLHEAGDLRLAGVAHFNHQLRTASDADEQFCRGLARSMRLPFLVARDDIAARARRERRSIEVAARNARHVFFERARQMIGADAIAVGHTREDQAETFLLRLIRGAGARGLASMHPRNGAVIRPLLECRRQALRDYLSARQAVFVEDASNADVSIPRNRVRAELLPLLEARFNPAAVDALVSAADIARDELDFLTTSADDWWTRFGVREDRRWSLDADALAAAPPALARMVLWRAMGEASGHRVGFEAVNEALAVARGQRGPLDAPRHRVERIAGKVVLRGRPVDARGRPAGQERESNLFRYSLSIPGEVRIAGARYAVSADFGGRGDLGDSRRRINQAVVRLDQGITGLMVRNRRPGDRFRPVGSPGQKKLQDFFVDRKVPRAERDAVPLVVDAADRIIWVAGHAVDEAFRVTDPTQGVIILRLKGVGGSV